MFIGVQLSLNGAHTEASAYPRIAANRECCRPRNKPPASHPLSNGRHPVHLYTIRVSVTCPLSRHDPSKVQPPYRTRTKDDCTGEKSLGKETSNDSLAAKGEGGKAGEGRTNKPRFGEASALVKQATCQIGLEKLKRNDAVDQSTVLHTFTTSHCSLQVCIHPQNC